MQTVMLKLSDFRSLGIVFSCLFYMGLSTTGKSQSVVTLNDLSFFRDPGKTWALAESAIADLQKPNYLKTSKGTGIIVHQLNKRNQGTDLYTREEYGDIDLELDYLMALGSNSGIVLQGRYEVELDDAWGVRNATANTNGGIPQRWDYSGGKAPRQNASRAPGLWQHVEISFRAPVFDSDGRKTSAAKLLRVELNGVIIHENVELTGPAKRGIAGQEKAKGPLVFQGTQGSVAFRNIKITNYTDGRPAETFTQRRSRVYPISVSAHRRPVFRSFMDLPEDIRVVHAISVASPVNVHYTYDADTGMILQAWRGDFLDATPMWYSRGDGSSRPVGAVQRFGKPILALGKLSSPRAPWKNDTSGTGFRPKGYILNENNEPVFQYLMYGAKVTDKTVALDNGKGIRREISISDPLPNLYVRLAEGAAIEEISKGLYLVDNNSYYLKLERSDQLRPVVRDGNGKKELVVPIKSKLAYSILF